MKKVYSLLFVLLPFLSFSQQQVIIRGIHPNFYLIHNVSPTEKYASISRLYNISSAQLTNYNDLSNHDGKIFARTLKIPLTTQNFVQKGPASNVHVPVDYVLSATETVTNVLARFKVTLQALKELNNATDQQLNSRNRLTVGYLKIKPEAISFFNTLKKETEQARIADTRKREELKLTEKPLTTDPQTTGIRVPKKRGDEVVVEKKTEAVPVITDSALDQNTPAEIKSVPSNSRSNRIKLFVDCVNTSCDNTYFRTEINVVDFLRDRIAADIHLLITSQRNGNGASQYQMIFYGQNKFKNLRDTLRFNVEPNATTVERRDAVLKYIKFGITPFIAKTDYAGEVNIQMKKDANNDDESSSNTSTKDKWNYWVFNAGTNGNYNLEELYRSSNYRGNFSANRTTEKLKMGFYSNAGQNIARFYDDSTKENIETIKNSNFNLSHSMVVSMGQHWSYAYEAQFNNSTYSNNKRRMSFTTGIEYAIFPYKYVNNKFWTITYKVGVRRNQYYDTTIYDKTEETLFEHEITSNLSVKQKWGSVSTQLEYSNYLHDFKQNNLSIDLNIDVRITGGLSVYGYTSAALVHDQVYLPKGGATPLEILTRRRQLASQYNFSSGFGINYRFGSKLNNFVNPRFDN